jgi:hypothetical protein
MSACLGRGHMELCSFSRVFERTPSVASLQGRALCLRPLTLKPPNITKKRQSRTAPRPSITRRAIRPPPLSTPTKPTATPPRRTLRPEQLIPRARARNRSKLSGGVQPLQTVAEEFEHRSGAGGTRSSGEIEYSAGEPRINPRSSWRTSPRRRHCKPSCSVSCRRTPCRLVSAFCETQPLTQALEHIFVR